MRIGTRGSLLATTQTETVADQLRSLGVKVEVVRIKTTGDVTTGSLATQPGIGVFAAELRQALLAGQIDAAVHSLKDLPVAAVPGLEMAAIPARVNPKDVLVSRDRLTFAQLPPGARVGTGSPRRVAQLRALRPDLNYVDLRGNLGTRLARVADGDLDAVVLAAAGLTRLGREVDFCDELPILPAPGQGALGVECRSEDEATRNQLSALDDAETRAAVSAERAVLAGLGGGCAAPIAAWATNGELRASVVALDGSRVISTRREFSDQAARLVVDDLLRQGAEEVVDLGATRESRLAEFHDDSALWRNDGALAGRHILLSRPDGELAAELRAAGAEVVCLPLTQAEAIIPDAWPSSADWTAITSAQTVKVLADLGRRLPPSRIAVVGAATARALESAGYEVALVPKGKASATSLLASWPSGTGTVFLPGSLHAKSTLADGLRAKGWQVQSVPVYRMVEVPAVDEQIRQRWQQGGFDAVLVTSGTIGAAANKRLGWPAGAKVIALGEQTAADLADLAVPVAAVVGEAGVVAAVQAGLDSK